MMFGLIPGGPKLGIPDFRHTTWDDCLDTLEGFNEGKRGLDRRLEQWRCQACLLDAVSMI